jgi:hypothetical protein
MLIDDDDDDIICPEDNEYFKNDFIYHKENVYQNILCSPFQRLDSCNSIKSNDLYYHSSVSNQNMDNISKNKEAIEPIDNYAYNFQNLLSSEEDCHQIIGDDVNDNNFNKSNYNPNNSIDLNKITCLPNEDIAIIVGQENKEIKGDTNTIIETIGEVTPSIKPKEGKKSRGKRGPYKKKPKPIIGTETNDYCFPFKSGKCLLSDDASDNKLKQYMNTIFRTNTYVTDSNGNKKKEKKQRKFKPDDIRKKIKVRFHKKIKNIINENLKKAGSTELFGFLPQYFISNIAKKFNNQFMNMTYEQLLKINFSELQDDYPNKACDNKQYEKNKNTLEYLEKNPEISKISGFDKVKKMKYRDIFKAYFSSAEFEESIEILKEEENESAEYIQEYFILAKNYIDYFINIDD